MKKNLLSTTVILLCAIILISCFAACSDTENKAADKNNEPVPDEPAPEEKNVISVNEDVVCLIDKTYSEIKEIHGEYTNLLDGYGSPLFGFPEPGISLAFEGIDYFSQPQSPDDSSVCFVIYTSVSRCFTELNEPSYSYEDFCKLTGLALESGGFDDYNGGYSYSFTYKDIPVHITAEEENCIKPSDSVFIKKQ